jgi:hypothetical protein
MLKGLTLALLLVAAAPAPRGTTTSSHTPEQLAVGAVSEIISAQAVHAQMSPQVGYACSLKRLVDAQLLLDVWLSGKRVDGYVFDVWCEQEATPQATFRASAVPTHKGPGSTLTVCTDQTNVPRTVEGDVAACFARGKPVSR